MKPDQKRRAALQKELRTIERQEKKIQRKAMHAEPAGWKAALECRIPERVLLGLKHAFHKGFTLIFEHGRGVIEHSYHKEDMRADYEIREFAVQRKGGRKELRQMHRTAEQLGMRNLLVTTVEGIGLGALGIGMPDVVLFLGMLLKGVYEMALNYGFDYESRQEQIFILKMMQTALSTGEDWVNRNAQVDQLMLREPVEITEEAFQDQLKGTAAAFAVDMLLLKFVQGLPVVGMIGGAGNPVYYSKIMKYVQLKYRKRYLLKQMENRTV